MSSHERHNYEVAPPPLSNGADDHSTGSVFSDSQDRNEEWNNITDIAERRRLRNRFAQRSFRKQLRRRLRVLQKKDSSDDHPHYLSRVSSDDQEDFGEADERHSAAGKRRESYTSLHSVPATPSEPNDEWYAEQARLVTGDSSLKKSASSRSIESLDLARCPSSRRIGQMAPPLEEGCNNGHYEAGDEGTTVMHLPRSTRDRPRFIIGDSSDEEESAARDTLASRISTRAKEEVGRDARINLEGNFKRFSLGAIATAKLLSAMQGLPVVPGIIEQVHISALRKMYDDLQKERDGEIKQTQKSLDMQDPVLVAGSDGGREGTGNRRNSGTWSIVSATESIFSTQSAASGSSSSSLHTSHDIIDRLVKLYLEDYSIKSVCLCALIAIPRDRFEPNLRRLLRIFADELREEASTEGEQNAASFVRHRATNSAHLICNKLDHPFKANGWIGLKDDEDEVYDESDSDRSEGTLDSIHQLEVFIKTPEAFNNLRHNLELFFWPVTDADSPIRSDFEERRTTENVLEVGLPLTSNEHKETVVTVVNSPTEPLNKSKKRSWMQIPTLRSAQFSGRVLHFLELLVCCDQISHTER